MAEKIDWDKMLPVGYSDYLAQKQRDDDLETIKLFVIAAYHLRNELYTFFQACGLYDDNDSDTRTVSAEQLEHLIEAHNGIISELDALLDNAPPEG